MPACCSASSIEAITELIKLLVDSPESVIGICNGQGIALSVALEDEPRLTARNGQTLRALSRVLGAISGDPAAAVFL